ncbi:hypothetical protein M8J76_006362 [Diaphorina citri]|nr:hypothetical protein M8J75_016462 [Diaphorina citri]KAI5716435.1 hypothetical protein M8J76_006362 [Diaphorina citri]
MCRWKRTGVGTSPFLLLDILLACRTLCVIPDYDVFIGSNCLPGAVPWPHTIGLHNVCEGFLAVNVLGFSAQPQRRV